MCQSLHFINDCNSGIQLNGQDNSPLFRSVDSLLISALELRDEREVSRRISHAPMMAKSLPTCNTKSELDIILIQTIR